MILSRVTHDIASNTLEAVWTQPITDYSGTITGYEQVKCKNYSSPQKIDFETDLGVDAAKYIILAGW